MRPPRPGRGRGSPLDWLAAALLLLGLTNLCYSVVPWTIDETRGSFDTWAPIAGRLLGAAGLALGALIPERRVAVPRRAAVTLSFRDSQAAARRPQTQGVAVQLPCR